MIQDLTILREAIFSSFINGFLTILVCDLVDPLLLLQGGVGQHNHAVFLDQLLCQLSCLLNITSLVVRSFLSDSRWGNEFIYKRSYRYCMSDTVPIEVISNT
jgi:hypothetical protein